MSPQEKIFECRKCGHCCEGRGGIILSDKDLARLASFLNTSPEEVARAYGETVNGKLRVKAGDDGNCIFLSRQTGCSVHEGKPDICRAWPYFRGNLEDPASLAMAKDFCPGINPDISFESFAEEGIRQIVSAGLCANNQAKEANSLIVDHLARARKLSKQESGPCPDAPVR